MTLASSPFVILSGETDSLANRLAESKDPDCDHMLIRLRGDFHDGPRPAAVTSKQQVIPRVREPFASEWLNSARDDTVLVSVRDRDGGDENETRPRHASADAHG